MKKIILASNSPQRKKLLSLLGLKFRVSPANVAEEKEIKTTCEALVKHNALIKARAVADRTRSGIVIGADTVVYIGNKQIVGKPKNYKDARRILRILFSRPQWVYTGVVIIDAATGKALIDYEKTKVFMIPLTDKEIDLYHKRVNPFDKAGGFDIEGWGSIFIHRIEGCYSNVIGLPMAKLAGMLQKFGVSILQLLLIVNLFGCATEYNLATQRQERLMYNTDQEVRIGDAFSRGLENQFTMITEVDVNERLEGILKRIVEVCDRNDIIYAVKLIDEEDLNAVSLPGGYVYMFRGLYDHLKTDDELAGVIAHEVGHITARHGIKRLQASYGYLLMQILATQTNAQVAGGVNVALASVFMEYSQADEFQADELGVKYMQKAGYDPSAMIKVLETLKTEQEKASPKQFSYWRTHPHLTQRMATVNQAIKGKLEFKDYLNLMGN